VAGGHEVINLDALTYAANLANVASVAENSRYTFVQADIRDVGAVERVFASHLPDAILHLAAESHVDRSIDGPSAFVDTNVVGTLTLLNVALQYWRDRGRPGNFRFLHVSTDEVFGSLGAVGKFTEDSSYAPRSPYAASKAASDHLVRAWHETYGLPVLVTNCSNNYGPFQFPEKLVPVVILAAIAGAPIPVYGTGDNVRDWLFVEDHAAALLTVLSRGTIGRTYNVGGESEARNVDLVEMICAILDRLRPHAAPHAQLVTFVSDRPGHDRRYAIDPSRIRDELGWRPSVTLEEGLTRTVAWYLDNSEWWQPLGGRAGASERLGLRAFSR
jgi:dTDP-glucose 4,6-dehydratase